MTHASTIMKSLSIFLSLTSAGFSASILWDPLPYFSEADSPFYQGILDGTIYLEDFEDQALNTPFVREPDNLSYFGRTIRSIAPDIRDGFVRSVDGDDGLGDFEGFLGDSWITTNIGSNTGSDRASFEFLPNDDGLYPSYVGIVITAANDLDRVVSLAFFDENNVNVSTPCGRHPHRPLRRLLPRRRHSPSGPLQRLAGRPPPIWLRHSRTLDRALYPNHAPHAGPATPSKPLLKAFFPTSASRSPISAPSLLWAPLRYRSETDRPFDQSHP